MHRIDVADFACPGCGSDVHLQSDSVICPKCERAYPVDDGIVDFRHGRKDYYFNPVPIDELRKLNSDYSPDRWNQTVRRLLSSSPSGVRWIDNVVVDGRYAWKVFLDVDPGLKFLDLECGLGNLSKNLAPHVGRLYAMDLNYERLGFAKNRFATFVPDEDCSLLAAGDTPRLPFRSDSLDIVALSGVLEWVGQGDMTENYKGSRVSRLWYGLLSPFGRRSPRRIQLDFLKEIRRVIKPDGQLFIGIENRVNYEYFGGRPDHHSGLLYGALFPRVVANLYSMYRNRRPYRTYTYTQRGYRRLLDDAGFPVTDFIGIFQGYSQVEELVPAAGDFDFWKPSQTKWRTQKGWKARALQHPFFAPAFGIISSSKRRPWSRLITTVLDEVAAELGDRPGTVRVARFEVTGKDKLIVHASHREQPIFIRIPCNPGALHAEESNHQRLGWLAEHRPALREYVPRAVLQGEVARQRYFVESGVTGASMVDLRREGQQLAGREDEGLRFLARLNPPGTGETTSFTGTVYAELVTKRIQRLRELLSAEQGARLEGLFREHLEGVSLPHGLVHGDYSAHNLFFEGSGVSGVVDWEESRSPGIPAIDAIGLLLSATNSDGSRSSLADRIVGFARREAAYAGILASIDRYYDDAGIDSVRHEGLVYLYWLNAVSPRLSFGLAYNTDGIEMYVSSVVKRLGIDTPGT